MSPARTGSARCRNSDLPFYLGAEDDEKEIHIRFYDIASHYGVTFKELIDGGLHVLCLLGQDATLCAVGKSGKVETTSLYRQLYEAAGDIKPKNISIDTLSRAFAGNEIDRVQVYAFAMHMQALAMVARGSVTVLSHPSLQASPPAPESPDRPPGTAPSASGSTSQAPKPIDGEQPDNDLRQLEFKKNQYGPTRRDHRAALPARPVPAGSRHGIAGQARRRAGGR